MKIREARLAELIQQIRGAQAMKVLPTIDEWLTRQPEHPALLSLKAQALQQAGRTADAIEAFRQAGMAGAGAQNWIAASTLLASGGETDDALHCLQDALAACPDNEDVLDALVTLLSEAGHCESGVDFARRQVQLSRNIHFLFKAALLLQRNDLLEEALQVFKTICELDEGDSARTDAAGQARIEAFKVQGGEDESRPMAAQKINLGCGADYMPGWLNTDQWPEANPDLVMNLEQLPWELEDNCADEIMLKHVLEHLGQSNEVFLGIFQELYRISRPDALVRIRVSHPRHKDFLSDPTHIRPILPELFACLDLATVEAWQENRLPGTPIAKYLKVDFEMVSAKHQLTPWWQSEHAAGRLDDAALMHAIESYNNVVQWTDITLRARKPFRPGAALRRFDAICLERQGGMGDMLMSLGAAKVVKALSDRPVIVATAPQFRSLVEACPHVDHVVDNVETLSEQYGSIKHVDLAPAAYGLSRVHQIDAYLQAFGVSAEAKMKSIDLVTNRAAEEEVDRLLSAWPNPALDGARIILHCSTGDPNRSWPRERWSELASKLIELGHQVIEIGANSNPETQPAATMPQGLLSAVNALSALGTVALMRRSDILVAADSGPVQLAAATDVGIVALFSVVAGSCRLPFRHGIANWKAVEVKPTCRYYPCYQQMHHAEAIAPFLEKIRDQTLAVPQLFAQWCPDGGSFACMEEQISVQMVMDAIAQLDPSIVAADRSSPFEASVM